MADQLKPSDKVKLPSAGSPEMTVITAPYKADDMHPLGGEMIVTCQWFDKSGKLCKDYFTVESLVRID